MKHALYSSVALIALAAGCVDEQAASQREARERLGQVVSLIAQADQGFVPKDSETELSLDVDGKTATDKTADIQAYRQDVLGQAAKELESIVEHGSVAQQVSVRRLLADVYASQTRFESREAMLQWAALADRSATLMSFLGSVDHADARIRLLTPDEAPLLARLKEDKASTQQRLKKFRLEATLLRKRSSDMSAQIDKLQSQADAQAQLSQQFGAQALQTTNSDEQYDLYDQAAAADRRTSAAAANAQELKVSLDVINSELAIIEKQIQLADQAIRTLNDQIASAQRRQSTAMYDEATASKKRTVDAFMQQFDQINQAYAQSVESPLEHATEKMTRAIDLLTLTLDLSDQDERLVQLEQLAHTVGLVHLLADRIQAMGSYGYTLIVISQTATRLMPDRSSRVMDMAKLLHDKQRRLIETAKQTISTAISVADQISRSTAEGDPLANIAKQQSQRLEAYRQRIDSFRLASPQV